MTWQQFKERAAKVLADHKEKCSGALTSYMHMDGRDWYSWSYRCDTCDRKVTTVKPRKPSAKPDAYDIKTN